MKKRVVITSMGAITGAGPNTEDLWNAVSEGRSAVSHLIGNGLTNYIGAQVRTNEISGYGDIDRSTALALHAAGEAISKSGFSIDGSRKIDVFVSSSKGGILSILKGLDTLSASGPDSIPENLMQNISHDSPSRHIASRFGLRGDQKAVVSACATGIHSVILAARSIAEGRSRAALAGSTEASITPLILAAYDSMQVLSRDTSNPQSAMKPFDSKRDGFVVGEGAGVLLLESLESAKKRDALIYAEVLGWAYGADNYGITSHNPDGNAIAAQISGAIEMAGIQPEDVDYISAHGTATRQNDMTEAAAIRTAFGHFCSKPLVSAIKPVTGHLLGSAGSIETIVTVLAMRNSTAPPLVNLTGPDPSFGLNFAPLKKVQKRIDYAITMNYGFGGHIGVLALGKLR